MRAGLKPRLLRKWTRQLVAALAYLHTRDAPIVHGAVRAESVLLDAAGSLRLACFERSSVLPPWRVAVDTYYLPHMADVVAHLPPEALDGSPLDGRADVWQLGLLLLELVGAERVYAECGGETARVRAKVAECTPPRLVRRLEACAAAPPVLAAFVRRTLTAVDERATSADCEIDAFLLESTHDAVLKANANMQLPKAPAAAADDATASGSGVSTPPPTPVPVPVPTGDTGDVSATVDVSPPRASLLGAIDLRQLSPSDISVTIESAAETAQRDRQTRRQQRRRRERAIVESASSDEERRRPVPGDVIELDAPVTPVRRRVANGSPESVLGTASAASSGRSTPVPRPDGVVVGGGAAAAGGGAGEHDDGNDADDDADSSDGGVDDDDDDDGATVRASPVTRLPLSSSDDESNRDDDDDDDDDDDTDDTDDDDGRPVAADESASDASSGDVAGVAAHSLARPSNVVPIVLNIDNVPTVKFDFNRDTDTIRGVASELLREFALQDADLPRLVDEISKHVHGAAADDDATSSSDESSHN
eukprot:TRINITY_DN1247_c0_g2_i1.p1 TRINITY_DN1247_c0_g2~~TRINITY_DN1247_c0_g2_i1.p1  ORF type:complete len:536 (-),score=433.42 TRINITY_DN1247_c0_g2_i1:14-1621(-)